MSTPVLTFFNNKGGVGKTSLIYHLAWMFRRLDVRPLAVDLDPQANLTAAFLQEEALIDLWDVPDSTRAQTVFECIKPLSKVGDLRDPEIMQIDERVHLLPGDLRLSAFESDLAEQWPKCLDSNPYRAMRVTTAFWHIIQLGAASCEADIVLVDIGPSLGAINRAALIATDFIVVPLAADLFSRQGLRNLGPSLETWRHEWQRRRDDWDSSELRLPPGLMRPIGYVIQQHGVRLSRPVKAFDEWMKEMPAEYARHILRSTSHDRRWSVQRDENRIATMKHYRSLIPLGQMARKPIFELSPADGARGSHATAARNAGDDFQQLAQEILKRMNVVPAA